MADSERRFVLETAAQSFDELRGSFRWVIPSRYNIAWDVCDRHAQSEDKTALYYEDDRGSREEYTFRQLKDLSNRFANFLSLIGLKRGDRVGIILPQRPEAAVAHLAVYKFGGIAVPISPLFRQEGLRYRLGDSGAKAVVTEPETAEQFREVKEHLKSLQHLILVEDAQTDEYDFRGELSESSSVFEITDTSADDPAMIIYTSGTTGTPKGALLPHRTVLGRTPGLVLAHHPFPQEGDLFWTPADWSWVAGLLDSLFSPWSLGVPVLAWKRRGFQPDEAFRVLEEYRVRNACIPPTALRILMKIQSPRRCYDIFLRSVHSGGESLPPDVFKWVRDELGIIDNEIYGTTEASFVAGNAFSFMAVKPGSLGRPYPGHAVEVVDEGRVLPPGQLGEMAVKRDDPVLFLGYWNDDYATAERFRGEWFLTGDLAVKDADGYIWFKGRGDDIIKSSGYRIPPVEVEFCILQHPAVEEVAVVASPDRLRGAVAKAFIKLREEYAPSYALGEEIKRFVKDRLAAHEYPREVEFLDDLPKTPMGKMARKELREREYRLA